MADDLQSRFAQTYGQQSNAPVSGSPQPNQGVSNSQPSLADRFKSVYGAQNSPQTAQNPQNDDGHGSIYHAADAILNGGRQDDGSFLSAVGEAPADLLRGAGKGLLSTAAGLGSIYNKVTGASQPFNQDNLAGLTDSKSAAQSVGKTAEQMAEYGLGGEGKLATKMISGGAISGIQSGGDPISAALGTVLPAVMSDPVVKMAGQSIAKALGVTTSKGEAAIARAFLKPNESGLVDAMKGKINVNDVVDNLQKTISDYSDSASASYRSKLPSTMNNQIDNWHAKSGEILDNLNATLDKELPKFGVKEDVDNLDLKHLTGAAPDDVKALVSKVRAWGDEARDLTPQGLDTLKKQISKMAYDSGSALPSRLADQLKTDLNAKVPGYEALTSEYHESQDLLKEVKKTLNASGKAGDNQNTIVGKLQNLLNQNTNYREMVLNKLPGGDKILDQIAGLHLHDTLPGKLSQRLLGAMVTGGIGFHPLEAASIPAALASSPRLVGEGARLAGKIAKSNVPVGSLVRKGTLAGYNQAVTP